RAAPAPCRRSSGEIQREERDDVWAQDDGAPRTSKQLEERTLVAAAHRFRATHATLSVGLPASRPMMVETSRVDRALQRSQDHLLRLQAPAGFWLGELEADTTITSEYLLFRHLLDIVNPDLDRKAIAYLRDQQGADGSRNLYEAGTGDLSATIKAYFAMKMSGVPETDPALTRAREWVLERGGPTQANVFTKITLALFGQYPWAGV